VASDEDGGKPREVMGFERPLNLALLAVLFAATWALWSLRAALALVGLLIVSTAASVWWRKRR
jgi:hypothetical protein